MNFSFFSNIRYSIEREKRERKLEHLCLFVFVRAPTDILRLHHIMQPLDTFDKSECQAGKKPNPLLLSEGRYLYLLCGGDC